jgi:hypothetical protein
VKNQLPAGGLTTGSHHRIVADTIRPQPATRPGDSRT